MRSMNFFARFVFTVLVLMLTLNTANELLSRLDHSPDRRMRHMRVTWKRGLR